MLASLLCSLALLPPAQEFDSIEDSLESSGWWTQNLRWSVDESARGLLDTRSEVGTFAFFGLDLHNVLTTDRGDLATIVLQPYLTRVDNVEPPPGAFDGSEDWEVIWRIFNVNWKLRQDGALNLRIGHFELPFGLEQTLDTNGTLRDYLHGANFGFKADWGATLNGELEALEYELAWSRGSGNEYRDEGNPGVVSGRVGTPREDNTVWGLSFLQGDFRTPGGLLERQRIALDTQVYVRDLGYFAEVAIGQDGDDTDVVRALGEVNWRNPIETWLVWLQVVGTQIDGREQDGEALDASVGARWSVSQGLSLSVQYSQSVDPLAEEDSRDGLVAFQVRYRF